ncbi:MAG: hypothetical protein R3254_00405 [Thiomicrorhabdus sp.]|nr:hypothetical protein [Thiomicrorhabdus sp.]
MATTDETFDPNDLESIDALLDEAELEAVSDLPTDEELTESVDDTAAEPEASLVEENVETDSEEDLLDSIDDLVANSGEEPEVVDVSEPAPQEQPVEQEVQAPPVVDTAPKQKTEAVPDTDEFLSKRASAQASKNSNIAAEDMDSIKKLIIIFGSILSVLVIVGIGIGVWGALAASSAGVDEETKTLIESIKVSSEQSGLASESAEKTAKSVEKKLDAINFQLEQLAADIGKLDGKPAQGKDEIIDPLGLGTHHEPAKTETKAPAVAAPETQVTTAPVVHNNELMDKVSSVNKKIISAQRRIDEVNNRVKKIQAQYASLIHSVKTVEKQVLIEQAEKAEKAESEKQKQNNNQYQYTAPDGGFYDQSVKDSYP